MQRRNGCRSLTKATDYSKSALALLGPEPMTVRVLDKRTIVGSDSSEAVAAERRIDVTKRFGSKMLEQVNRAGLAVAVDNTSAKWTDALRERP